jgi:hypothetical protein
MAVVVSIEKETLVVDFVIWTMTASWVGAVANDLKEKGCMREGEADLAERNLVHGVTLAIEAYKNKDVEKMNMARDIIIGVMDKVLNALDNCSKGGEKA